VALCFAENGLLRDEGKVRRGRAAIRQWKEEADAKYRYVSEPLRHRRIRIPSLFARG
jgi:hypothetical protein